MTNGYNNWETYHLQLHIANNEELNREVLELLAAHEDKYDKKTAIKQYFDDIFCNAVSAIPDETQANLVRDLCGLLNVNWYEIVEANDPSPVEDGENE